MSDPDQTSDHIDRRTSAEATGEFVPSGSAAELLRVLDQYLADLQAGRAPEKAKLLADHPELAYQLEQCLSGIEFVHKATKPAGETPAQLGDFRIVGEVGRGGMGVVYEAEQISLKRKVALKVLRFGAVADADVMKRFQREAETVAHLHHTNIVPIHAVGCEQGVHYYAMQFIEGKSLAEVLTQSGAEGKNAKTAKHFREVAGWALQASEALAHAHQRGVIHRDIKPSNLILDPEGTVWLTDFGLAKRADEVTMTAAGVLMGTPRYMSPEQAASALVPIDHRTDIYSLGATLYELATGRPVFDAQTPQGVITQILTTEPRSPRLIQGQLPRDLETIILKCLHKEPAKRYPQARDLADDLRSYLENRPIKARRVSLVERTLRWAKKKRASAIVAGVAAAAAAILLGAGYFGWSIYQTSLLSHLVLTTEGPGLVAELLDEHDELVLPSFPVPTPRPVAVRAGSYRLRLAASGQLSETWNVDLERGTRHEVPVKMLDRLLGPPLEFRGSDAPMLIELNGQTHLVHRTDAGWRLVNGATLKPVWPSDLAKFPVKPNDSPYPRNNPSGGDWDDILQINSTQGHGTGNSPGLAQPAFDLDGDGKDDLILASRVSPSLLALSGTTGKVLWWYRAPPNMPPTYDPNEDPLVPTRSAEQAGIIGQPVVVNIEGEPTVIATFVSFSAYLWTEAGKEFRIGRTYYVEAITARSGKRLWRSTFEMPELANTYQQELIKLFPDKPAIVQLQRRDTVLLAINTKLFGFDLKTGKESWPAYDVGARPLQAPRVVDFAGDPGVLLLVRKDDKDYNSELTLRMVGLAKLATLWERSFLCPAYTDRNTWRAPGTELAWVADPDGARKPKIIIPIKDDWSRLGHHWLGVEALDGATGSTLWQRRLWSTASTFSQSGTTGESVRCLVGPDLDGDGHAEIFVASIGSRLSVGDEDATSLQVDALSGENGSVLWRRRHKVDRETNPFLWPGRLQWWQTGLDGRAQLVVPVVRGPGGQAVTYVLAASTGLVTHLLPEVADPHVVDLNSDGIPDLFHIAASASVRRLVAFKGVPPVEWRRPRAVQRGADFDGDGVVDLLEFHDGIEAHSGRDGHLLWHAHLKCAQPLSNQYEPLLLIDIDKDGIPDVIAWENHVDDKGSHTTVSAFSGTDGHRLWRGPELGMSVATGWGRPDLEYHYPFLDYIDLHQNGSPLILVATQMDKSGLCLAALSGKDGVLLWKIPILPTTYTGRSLIDRNLFYDLNGDGVLDLVLWVPEKVDEHGNNVGRAVLRAFSGRDGKPLWETDPVLFTATHYLWPRVAAAALDGDGMPAVVVTTYGSQNQGRTPCELAVLDGRDGRPKWRWNWEAYDLDVWPPLLVDADGDGKHVICLGVSERLKDNRTARNIIVFNSDGTTRQKIGASVSNNLGRQDPRVWTTLDFDGSGKEAIIYQNENGVRAYSLREEKELWTWPTRGFMNLQKVWPAKNGKPGTLALWNDVAFYFLDTKTGTTSWRCDLLRQDSVDIRSSLIDPPASRAPPTVLWNQDNRLQTTAQRLLPTLPDGHYHPASPTPLDYAGLELMDPVFRRLPWSSANVPLGPAVMMLCFVLTLLYWSFQGRWRRVLVFLTVALVLATGLAILMITKDHAGFEPNERYAADGWFRVLLLPLYVGFLPIALAMIVSGLVWAVRRMFRPALLSGQDTNS